MNINNELTDHYFFSLLPLEQYLAVYQLNNTIILHHIHCVLSAVLCCLLLSQHHFYVINAFFQVLLCCLGLCKAWGSQHRVQMWLKMPCLHLNQRGMSHIHTDRYLLVRTFWALWGFWFRSSLSTAHPPAAAKILALLWSKCPPGSAVLLSQQAGSQFSAQEGTCPPWKVCWCHLESPTFGGVASWPRFSPDYFRNLRSFSD